MAKHGEGLGYEIVKAVNNGEIKEPITFKKVKDFCKSKGLNPSESHMRVILSNSTENTHSPTYAKYFVRVAKGEYEIHPDYRKKAKYYWLNIDTEGYEWSFSDLKVGRRETYSSLNEDGGKRKNESCFQSINIGDKVVAYETGKTKAITTICIVVDKYENDDGEVFVEFEKLRDFDKFLTLNEMKDNNSLSDCDVIGFHRGTLFELKEKHYIEIVKMLENINSLIDYYEVLEREVQKSRVLTSVERKNG